MADLMTIGEVAHRAHVATSTIRYYERRGLLSADARQSGQRRYRIETLRRLVFIGMMQDIGLTLDEVYGILHAATAAEWKAIAGQRLAALDDQIAQRARDPVTGRRDGTLLPVGASYGARGHRAECRPEQRRLARRPAAPIR